MIPSDIKEKPSVSIYVITYNAEKTVKEALDSVRNQTYQKLRLIISDDCSSDNTVDICRKWIADNKDRFESYQLLTVKRNMGVTDNVIRAVEACDAPFAKGLAGDDKLMPNCIEDNVNYMMDHPQSLIVYSRMKVFGKIRNTKRFESIFDYSFFDLSAEKQHERLISQGNCVPAVTSFYRIQKLRELGFKHDSRIPMYEDLPQHLMMTAKGVKLDFFDKETVWYRVGEGGLTSGSNSYKMLKSRRLFRFYYLFDHEYNENKDEAIKKVVEEEMEMVNRVRASIDYRIGHFFVNPIRRLYQVFERFK